MFRSAIVGSTLAAMGQLGDSFGSGRKPTHASVTDAPCKCGYLERASDEPMVPIVFDEQTNEYHIENVGDAGHRVIYHCPFCGGAAPPSKRGSLFATITQDENSRLIALATGFKTVKQAVAKLGTPDDDMPAGLGMGSKPTEGEAPTFTSYRTLTYKGLSETADVVLIDYGPEHGLRVTLRGKYLGKPEHPSPPKRKPKRPGAKR
jgi:hypothetical protein